LTLAVTTVVVVVVVVDEELDDIPWLKDSLELLNASISKKTGLIGSSAP
jgi:hypothetical protein